MNTTIIQNNLLSKRSLHRSGKIFNSGIFEWFKSSEESIIKTIEYLEKNKIGKNR